MKENTIIEVKTLLPDLDAVSLKDMNNILLLNRQDTKFVVNLSELPQILQELKPFYYTLEISGNRLMQYESLYFDTEDYRFYTQHHNGKQNRYKVRYRKYVESDICFFEIKFKSNTGRTIKTRIPRKSIKEKLGKKPGKLFQQQVHMDPDSISPKLWIYFKRITLAHKDFTERATIDINLQFRHNSKEVSLPDLAIIEVKQNRMSRHSEIIQILRKKKIRPARISKYCTGILLTRDEIKYNRFKPRLLSINKFDHGRMRATQ